MSNGNGDMTSAFATALESASAPVSEASPASPPVTETTPAETTPAAATAQPAATDQAPASASPAADALDPNATEEPPKGEPPKWRWQDILANARETSAKEAEARIKQEYEAKYGGLDAFATLNPQERDGMLVWHRALSGDPQARALVAQVDAKVAASMGWTSAPADDPEPEPDYDLPVKDANGNIVGTQSIYSAAQQKKWQEWSTRRLTAQIRQELQKDLQPVHQVVRTHQVQQAYADVAAVIAEMKAADPAFDAHKADVGTVLRGDPQLWALADTNPKLAVETAWHRVWREKVLPKRDQESEAKVLANLQQKAAAGSVNPNAPATATPPRFTPGQDGFAAALAHFAGTDGR